MAQLCGAQVGVRQEGEVQRGYPDSMVTSLVSLWLRAGLFTCRAKPPEDGQIANETGLSPAVREGDQRRAHWGSGSAKVGRPPRHLVNTIEACN